MGQGRIMACLDENVVSISARLGVRVYTAGSGNRVPRQYAKGDPHVLLQPRRPQNQRRREKLLTTTARACPLALCVAVKLCARKLEKGLTRGSANIRGKTRTRECMTWVVGDHSIVPCCQSRIIFSKTHQAAIRRRSDTAGCRQ